MINIFISKGMSKITNFGDSVNTLLVSKLTGKDSQFSRRKEIIRYMVAGSIIHVADKNCIIWGSGLMFPDKMPIQKPKEILAVRGPQTHKHLIKNGISCPEIYGDPVLLFNRIYNPSNVEKKYEVGIIPHYIDKNHEWIKRVSKNKNIKIIDIQNRNFFQLVDEVLSCNKILSSSLHGIIIGDTYRIPSYWIRLSDKVSGGAFKFSDYYASINRKLVEIKINVDTSMNDIRKQLDNYDVDINLDPLIKCCPFGSINKE